MRISDWSSDVCSSDLNTLWVKVLEVNPVAASHPDIERRPRRLRASPTRHRLPQASDAGPSADIRPTPVWRPGGMPRAFPHVRHTVRWLRARSEEHTSELQSLMRISYAVFCLKKKNN